MLLFVLFCSVVLTVNGCSSKQIDSRGTPDGVETVIQAITQAISNDDTEAVITLFDDLVHSNQEIRRGFELEGIVLRFFSSKIESSRQILSNGANPFKEYDKLIKLKDSTLLSFERYASLKHKIEEVLNTYFAEVIVAILVIDYSETKQICDDIVVNIEFNGQSMKSRNAQEFPSGKDAQALLSGSAHTISGFPLEMSLETVKGEGFFCLVDLVYKGKQGKIDKGVYSIDSILCIDHANDGQGTGSLTSITPPVKGQAIVSTSPMKYYLMPTPILVLDTREVMDRYSEYFNLIGTKHIDLYDKLYDEKK